MKKQALALSIVAILAGCSSSDSTPVEDSLNLRILHINDHHSKVDASEKQSFNLGGVETYVDVGGFPRLVTKFNERDSGNVLKLHAGDAITGTMYYSLFRDELPDALMMNQVCFDTFALGNHEFDDGNEQLAHFIKTLTTSEEADACGTDVVAANVQVDPSNPIAGLYTPYEVYQFGEHQVGVIGIDIGDKTKDSSSPSEDTVFLDEVETAQKYIDKLKSEGVNHIVLLTHYTYENDVAMASQLSGVDVIVGGDSHSLLGDAETFAAMGQPISGDYPTILTNADGNDVCIVQAWDNAKAMGELNIQFNSEGNVVSCDGHAHLPLGDNFTADSKGKEAHSEAELKAIRDYVAATAEVSIVAEDATTVDKLAYYSAQIEERKQEIIGSSDANLCNERVPGQGHASGSLCGVENANRDFLNAHGSVMANIVTDAFAHLSLRSDIALQNSGGVRTSIPAGQVSVSHAFNVLPFTNYLVNLDMTGQEIVNTLEDALDNVVANNSSGAFPAATNLRFDVDLNKAKGSRASNVEARRRGENSWHPIKLDETYVVVTNDFVAAGGDSYLSMVPAFEDDNRREDTGLLYTDSLINYIKALHAEGKSLQQPTVDEMAVQNFIPLKSN